MPLSTFEPKRRKVSFDGGSVSVRALTTVEIASICGDLAGEIGNLVDHAFTADPSGMLQDRELVRGLLWALLRHGPSLVGRVIAFAADAPGEVDKAAALPIDVQLAAIEQIVALTFPDPGKIGQLAKTIGNLASQKSAAISGPRQ